MKEKLTNNLAIKLIALFCAFFVWLAVVNVANPIKVSTREVPVTITNDQVLEQAETPGLGTHIVEWFKNADKAGQNIIGRKATGSMTVSKDGGDVDAITAATISSRAFLLAVNKAYAAYTEGEVEAASGASQQATPKVSEEAAAETCACGKPMEECCKAKGTPCEGACNGQCSGKCAGKQECQHACGNK